MSNRQVRAPEPNAAAHVTQARREFVRGRWIVRGLGLLYAAYFFLVPAYRHSFAVWTECAAFFAAFLVLFFLAVLLTGRRQTVTFVLFFLFTLLYYLSLIHI